MTIAETIKTLRKTAGMSQEQLAEKLHVSRQAVTKWETEGGTPDIENLRAIATLFGITGRRTALRGRQKRKRQRCIAMRASPNTISMK